MILSHRFGSPESLNRAQYWLTRHGFEVAKPDPESHDPHCLALLVDLPSVSAALALINSIELSAPEGWPEDSARTKTLHSHGAHLQNPSATPIHWQKADGSSTADPQCNKVCEYMFSRWE